MPNSLFSEADLRHFIIHYMNGVSVGNKIYIYFERLLLIMSVL
jgi:hypothetical protein